MAISTGGGGETPMSDINTTPLVDVMLVMLIIFIIAVPVALQTIEDLEIPVFKSVESENKVENLLLTVSTTDEAGLEGSANGTADVIVEIDGTPMRTFEALADYIDSKKVGDEVTLTVNRDGEQVELTATLKSWDSSA